MISRRIILHIPATTMSQPIISRLVKDFDLDFNILKASVNPKEEGIIIMELSGSEGMFEEGIQFLHKMGVHVQPLRPDIKQKEERCLHCGACTIACPTGARTIDPITGKVDFHQGRCMTCGSCIKVCSSHAIDIRYHTDR